MKRFYVLLAAVVLIGGGVIWYGSRRPSAGPAPSPPPPRPATHGGPGVTRPSAAGVDLDKYDACMDGQRYAGRIQASLQEGEALGVGGTPTFYVNGKRFDGHPTSDAFKSLVDSLTQRRK